MKKLSSLSVRVRLAASIETATDGGLIEQEFILLIEQIYMVPGLCYSLIKTKHEVGRSVIFLVFPSLLQNGCYSCKHHILS